MEGGGRGDSAVAARAGQRGKIQVGPETERSQLKLRAQARAVARHGQLQNSDSDSGKQGTTQRLESRPPVHFGPQKLTVQILRPRRMSQ